METYNTTPKQTQQRVISARARKRGKRKVEENFSHLRKLVVEYCGIDDLKANKWNPNRQSDHDFELLLRSMEDDGFTQPIIAELELDEGRHTIIDGEHRWRAAQALGIEEVPVVYVNMTREQAMVSTMRHNKARGEHDIELEAAMLRDFRDLGFLAQAQELLLMDDVAVAKMLDDTPAPELLAADEYSTGWVPDKAGDSVIGTDSEEGVKSTTDGTETITALTSGAIEETRARERALAAAKTQEERKQAEIEHAVYRVSLIFSGKEAELVRSVLGNKPAISLLRLCELEAARSTTGQDKPHPVSRSAYRRLRAQGAL